MAAIKKFNVTVLDFKENFYYAQNGVNGGNSGPKVNISEFFCKSFY